MGKPGEVMDQSLIIPHLAAPQRFEFHCLETVASTNEIAADLARSGAPAWGVVVAETQTAGKGRHRRKWHSPPGLGIWMSVILRPVLPVKYLNLINLLAAFTLAHDLEQQARVFTRGQLHIRLKWPNDLLVDGKKLSGILLESSLSGNRPEFVILGIGLNVNQSERDFPPELQTRAVSLAMLTGMQWQREALLAGFLEAFYENYHRYLPENLEAVRQLYQEKVLFRNQPVEIRNETTTYRGTFAGITAEGYMVLKQNGQEKIITTGEIFDICERDYKKIIDWE